MDWITWIVPAAGGLIALGVVVIGYRAIRDRGQMPARRMGRPSQPQRHRINPKTGTR